MIKSTFIKEPYIMMTLARTALVCFAVAAPLAAQAQTPAPVTNRAITETEVLAAQKGWCDALVNISQEHEKNGQAAAKKMAEQVIDGAYGYQIGPVLFKPTLAEKPQVFRLTRAGALAYFVGGDPAFPKDKGFALKGWTKCDIKNAGIFITGNTAMTIGNVDFTDKTNKLTVVDKTWGFVKGDDGRVRIVLHHSSIPYGQ
jgi:hypothetical protein